MPVVKVTAKKGALQFLITKPLTVALDGVEHVVRWGSTADIPAAPGDHRLEAYFMYLGRPRGKVERTITVGDEDIALRYKTPFVVTSGGHLDTGP